MCSSYAPREATAFIGLHTQTPLRPLSHLPLALFTGTQCALAGARHKGAAPAPSMAVLAATTAVPPALKTCARSPNAHVSVADFVHVCEVVANVRLPPP